MRENDLLDGAWDEPQAPEPAPRAWQRKSCRELDAVFGVVTGQYDEDDLFFDRPKPKPQAKAKPKPRATAKPKRKRRRKATKVTPDEARNLLDAWVRKLLKAREMVQKYRSAVRRYERQGR